MKRLYIRGEKIEIGPEKLVLLYSPQTKKPMEQLFAVLAEDKGAFYSPPVKQKMVV